MAGYGSTANPVQLDPFRRIVEVHWSNDKYIAFQWSPSARADFIDDTESCSPVEYGGPFTGYPAPPHPVGFTYLSGVEYYLAGSEQGVSGISVWHGEWATPADTVTITGLPEMPAPFSHSAWEDAWLRVFGTTYDYATDAVHGHAENDLAASFAPASGTDTEIKLPSGTGFFQTGFTPSFGYRAQAFVSSDPFCYTDGSVISTVRMYSETVTWIDTFAVTLSNVVATYKGKTYRGVAARQVDTTIGSITLARSLWILCERETTP